MIPIQEHEQLLKQGEDNVFPLNIQALVAQIKSDQGLTDFSSTIIIIIINFAGQIAYHNYCMFAGAKT